MGLLEAEDVADLAVRQKRLKLAKLALHRHVRIEALQKLARRQVGGGLVVGGVEDLVAEAVLLHSKVGDLAEGAGVHIAPGDPLAETRVGKPSGEKLVLVRLDDVAD